MRIRVVVSAQVYANLCGAIERKDPALCLAADEVWPKRLSEYQLGCSRPVCLVSVVRGKTVEGSPFEIEIDIEVKELVQRDLFWSYGSSGDERPSFLEREGNIVTSRGKLDFILNTLELFPRPTAAPAEAET